MIRRYTIAAIILIAFSIKGASAAMPGTTPIIDDFNRANAEILNSAWSVINPVGEDDLAIRDGMVARGNFTDADAAMYWDDPRGPDCEVYITYVALGDPGVIQTPLKLFLRITDPGATFDGYVLSIGRDGVTHQPSIWTIRRIDDAIETAPLASVSGVQVQDGDRAVFEAYGDQFRGFLIRQGGWREVVSVTDGTYTDAGHLAFGGGGAYDEWRYDDFGGGDIVYGEGEEPGSRSEPR